MATKKPWRTVLTGTSTGRFTREQIRDAMDSVSSKSKAGADGGASAKGKGSSSIVREGAPNSAGAAASEKEKPAKPRNDTPD